MVFEENVKHVLVPGSVRVWRGGEGKTEEPVLVTGWHLAPELVPQVKSKNTCYFNFCLLIKVFFLSHFLEAECLLV